MRFLLLPFSLLYGLAVSLRNFLYDKGWLRSFEFDFPIILIGNLNTGGTGKTPHVEYLVRLLKDIYKPATLSRGYKRKLRGYALATELSLVEDIGDEPKQFKQKFPGIEVCVSEDRVAGVYHLLQDEPSVQVIIMDDGLQHRRVKPGLQILLTGFNKLFCDDVILPAGNLREPKRGYKRAHIIIVTKCPEDMDEKTRQHIINKLRPLPHQKVFFTVQIYEPLRPLFPDITNEMVNGISSCLFVSGIADSKSAISYLKTLSATVRTFAFRDHHYFNESDINEIKRRSGGEIIITTEKDAMRLMEKRDVIIGNGLSIFILPLSIKFLFNGAETFNAAIESYIGAAIPDK